MLIFARVRDSNFLNAFYYEKYKGYVSFFKDRKTDHIHVNFTYGDDYNHLIKSYVKTSKIDLIKNKFSSGWGKYIYGSIKTKSIVKN